MTFFSRKDRRATRNSSPKLRHRLQLETLEDRCLLSAGALDPTFGAGGLVVTSLSTKSDSDRVFDMAIQSDGKIIAVGDTYNSNTGQNFALVRNNLNGTLDTTFGGTGKVTTDFRRGSDLAYAVAVQPNGKIIAAGYAVTTVQGYNNTNFALARYNSNGTLDSTFGSQGKVITPVSVQNSDEIRALVLQSDGTIVVAGFVNSASAAGGTNFALARYTAAGALDTSFGSGGTVVTDFGVTQIITILDDGSKVITEVAGADNVYALTIQPDGRIVVTGQTNANNGGSGLLFAAARYNSNGSLDASFGSVGKVTTRPGLSGAAYGVTVQADGRIVAGGYATFDDSAGTRRWGVGLIRYNVNGSLDDGSPTDSTPADSFGVGGLALAYNPSGQGVTQGEWSMALQADGKIVMAGYQGSAQSLSGGTFLVGRFSSFDGGLDPSFGAGGWVTTSFPAPPGATNTGAKAQAVAIQSDGKIVAAGFAHDGTQTDFALARYQGDSTAIAAATAVRQSSPTVTGRHPRALNSIVTIPSHEDARHHTARTEAADQAIASLLGSETRRRFGPSRRLDMDAKLLADIALLV